MNTKLVYLYIKDINRSLNNLDFNFTDDFIIGYNPKTQDLHIEKKELKSFELWGGRINSIDLIVGKNGAGKSTVLDLIAETNINRRLLFNRYRKGVHDPRTECFSEWFAIYHVEKNKFIVEGAEPNLLFNDNQEIEYEYSFVCSYDFDEKKLNYKHSITLEKCNLQKNNELSLDNTLLIMYGGNFKKEFRLQNTKRSRNSDDYMGFRRIRIPGASISNIYHFLTKEYEMMEKERFTAQNVVCILDKEDFYLETGISKREMKNFKLLYHGEAPLTPDITESRPLDSDYRSIYYSFSMKEKFIITLLESFIVKAWINEIDVDNKNQNNVNALKKIIHSIEFNGLPEEQSFENLLEYLFSVLNLVCGAISKKYHGDEKTYYAIALIEFIGHIQRMSNDYFISPNKIEIPINGDLDEEVEQVLTVYDIYSSGGEKRKNDLQNVINVYYENMSKGEMTFINHFSSLYKAITASEDQIVRNVIICLDEPEESFHPEWARKYIYYLTTFLNQINKNNNVKYQIIISTHSPFIVSDIPKNNIKCIQLIEENGVYSRFTEKANFGFGSNLYDIIKNDFFLNSSIGEFATKEINKILLKINEMTEYDEKNIKKFQAFINIIDDEFIQNKLTAILKKRVREIMSKDEKNTRIRELEEELLRLKGSKND
ncbi:AAA family ATPase [Bacillus pacificus]|uniref:AAA family ATPase n=1 Tax=Bacillus pacificus TaxID=2026187 RepID=UPI00156BB7B6|nr:AAA family ATPase [Bacillus pacificus]NRR17640.1 AAA family ATPase [Bacillus pacificus]